MSSKEFEINLVKINPNNNGLYYDVESYRETLLNVVSPEYSMNNKIAFDYKYSESDRMFATVIPNNAVIGKVKSIDFNKNTAVIIINDKHYIDHIDNLGIGNFRLGFCSIVNTDDNYIKDGHEWFILDKVLYFVLQNKNGTSVGALS